MTIILDGTTGITNDGGYTGDGISFADTTPANTLVTTTGGNVGIGTASPSTKLNIYGSSPSIYLEQNSGVAGNTQIRLNAAGGANTASIRIQDKYIWNSTANGSLLNFGADLTTPQMLLDASGNLLVGTTDSGSGATAAKVRIIGSTANNLFVGSSSAGGWRITSDALNDGGVYYHIKFTDNGTQHGSITSNGTNTAYNTTSDYRLKENIAPMTGALATVSALKPCTYTWKENGQEDSGFIAHELQEVCPSAVTGEKDAVNEDGSINPQQIDTSFLVATLTAAIQELKAELDATKAEVAALKAK